MPTPSPAFPTPRRVPRLAANRHAARPAAAGAARPTPTGRAARLAADGVPRPTPGGRATRLAAAGLAVLLSAAGLALIACSGPGAAPGQEGATAAPAGAQAGGTAAGGAAGAPGGGAAVPPAGGAAGAGAGVAAAAPPGWKLADASVTRGRQIYATNCAGCHGDAGDGRGEAAGALVPKPTNFTDAALMSGRSDWDLYRVVRDGGPAAGLSPAMVGFAPLLPESGLRDVTAFVRTFAAGAKPAAGH